MTIDSRCTGRRGLVLPAALVGYSAWAVFSCWALSVPGWLGAAGFGVSFVVAVAVLAFFFRGWCGWSSLWRRVLFCLVGRWRWRWRWRRIFPLFFVFLASVALLGGLMTPPNNYDFLIYRFSRMLHWMAEGGWHWIPTLGTKMNISGVTAEMGLLPLFAATVSDRLLFLPNWLAFLSMPALVFSAAKDLGIRPRLAWKLMWVLPSGGCYAMQAAGAGNDLLGAWFFLAALAFALRASRQPGGVELWLALAASALLTGVKASNLPLLLPLSVALAPAAWRYVQNAGAGGLSFRRAFYAVVLFLSAIPLSFLPLAVMNHIHAGSWTGDPDNLVGVQIDSPAIALAGNFMQLGVSSATPPLFPPAKELNRWIRERIDRPDSFASRVRDGYPRFSLAVGEIPNEEQAGIGFGLSLLFVISCLWIAVIRFRGAHCARRPSSRFIWQWAVFGAGWVAFLVYMGKMGSENTARLLAAYYPLLFLTPFRFRAAGVLARSRGWAVCAFLAAASILPPVLITPSRPVVPPAALIAVAERLHLPPRMMDRLQDVYATYEGRHDILAPLRDALPLDARVIGWLATAPEPEISLWRPFGSRRVIHVIPTIPGGDINPDDSPDYFVVSSRSLAEAGEGNPDDWIRRHGFQVIARVPIRVQVRTGVVDFHVLEKIR